MKTKIICWLKDDVYTNETIRKLLIENGIAPMLHSLESGELWDEQDKPETLKHLTYDQDFTQQPYLDEPYSVGVDEWVPKDWANVKDLVVGETSTETIQQLVDVGVKNITYTAYGWHLWRVPIINLNVRMPFSTQLNTWKKLEKLYGKMIEYNDVTFSATWKSKFNFCWIHITQQNDFKELIKWCIDHNKMVAICGDDKKSVEYHRISIEKFISEFNRLCLNRKRHRKFN